MAMLTPAIAQSVMSMFEEIHLASLVDVGTGSRKEYLAKLFGSLFRISATRCNSGTRAPTTQPDYDAFGLPSTGSVDNMAQGSDDFPGPDLLHGLETNALLSADELDRWMAGVLAG
jgi:hypothetical protein